MKLTKKLEGELKELYVKYFDSLFSADVRRYESFFVDDFKQIGTTLEEVWFSKTESGKYLETHVEPVAGKIEFRNRDIRMEAVDQLILIIEQADCYVKIDGVWTYYDKARVSSLLQKTVTGWKFVQQHISFPDSRTEEGQTVGLEKIKSENNQLRDAVKRRTAELENTNRELENAILKLKSTQAQLIQSEKMASLGQLTAGIAHEIQNPLNFVNNFSEVSAELVDEIQDIRRKTQDRKPEREEDEILEDIKQNLERINHHGKRADAIVKQMLEHSRVSPGERVPTDINALADEYLRLSYHAFLSGRQGMRAKDKNLNAVPIAIGIETDFDPNLPIVNVVPQDIGRVLLNIINNSFYACAERLALSKAEVSRIAGVEQGQREKGIETGAQDEPNPYSPIPDSPLVKISTKNLGDKIEISISDNGPGIPDSIKDKIFQPFFTTKPTGLGTGLGLSLSYDIVKAHGGEIRVLTNQGEGSKFIIELPTKN